MTPEKLIKISKRLGVTEELLLEARVLAKKPQIFRKVFARVDVNVPPPLIIIIREKAKEVNTTGTGLLRSLLYRYLKENWEPPYRDTWTYMGVRYVAKKNNIKATISPAAMKAFNIRMDRIHSTKGKTMRSLYLGYLEGNFYRNLEIVTRYKFSQEVDSYCLGG